MSILTPRLFRLVEREFPGVSLPKSAMFLPVYSLDVGELSTTVAVEIAKATKQRAEAIAARLIDGLSREVRAEWRHDNGYIVCSQLPSEVLLAEVHESVVTAVEAVRDSSADQTAAMRRVWCLLPDSTEPVYARMRLLARATLQALLAVVYEGRAQLVIFPYCDRTVATTAEVLEVFQRSVQWISQNEAEDRTEVALPPDTGERFAVWTTHHYHERLAALQRTALAQLRRSGRVQVSMPADGWLLSRDRALSQLLEPRALHQVVGRLDGLDSWFRFLLHLAGTTPSGDFDPAVALFDESASPLWNMRALLERYRVLCTRFPLPLSRPVLTQAIHTVKRYRNLVLSGLFLPLYTARAIVHNEIDAWCEAFERLGREGHSFLNAPATRLALAQNGHEETCNEIAAGLGFGLSCIVPLVVEE